MPAPETTQDVIHQLSRFARHRADCPTAAEASAPCECGYSAALARALFVCEILEAEARAVDLNLAAAEAAVELFDRDAEALGDAMLRLRRQLRQHAPAAEPAPARDPRPPRLRLV